nr:T cell receptor beta chain MC.7.G5-like [Misgurnus anguillicaudatus]
MASFSFLFTWLLLTDFSDGVLITQWPKFISDVPGSSVEMHCYQNDTNYEYKYWYRQKHGEWPVLIGSYIVNSATNEKDFESGFKVSGTEKKKWTLMVEVKKESNAVYLCAAKSVTGLDITQTPALLSVSQGKETTLKCGHNDGSYYYMYWYIQRSSGELSLLAFSPGKDSVEIVSPFSASKYTMVRPDIKESTLKIVDLKEDSGVYFCASSSQAYFGNGTKLTVLESGKDVTEPEVKIIGPSKKQLCKKTVTLVCVAENFYPDHVTIKWKIGSDDVTKGVATDPYATKDKTGKFDMSSRLKIKSNEYHNPAKKFTCIVSFYNGTDYIDKSDTVKGIVGKGFNKENHMTEAATVKLAYGVFIAKSGLYGIFIFFFVRRQVSAGK